MMEIAARDLFPPGEYIRDELAARNWTQEDLAAILDRPLKSVNQIIMGKKSITPKTAQSLGAAFGTSAELWLNLESAHRLAIEAEDQEHVLQRAKLFAVAPVNEMLRRQWIKPARSVAELEKEVRRFLSVDSIESAPEVRLAARWSASYTQIAPAQLAWVLRVRSLAERLTCSTFSKARALQLMDKLHSLTTSPQEVRRVPQVLAEMGIRFVVVEHLSGTRIDGVATWIGDDRPIIGVSLRYDRIDAFWHTLAHEVRHILNGDQLSIDENLIAKEKIGTDDVSEMEQRADQEASEFLIPNATLHSFIVRHRPRFSKVKIVQFANLHQIHPGIVVGQLQFRKAIQYSHSREMLVGVRDILVTTALTDGWGHFPGQ